MELQKLLQDEIREGLYRITISGPRGDSEVSKVRIRPVEIKGKLLFQSISCCEKVYRILCADLFTARTIFCASNSSLVPSFLII